MGIFRISTTGKVLNKKSAPYNIDGHTGVTFKLTLSQNDDSEIGEERVTEDLYKMVEKGTVYVFYGTKRSTRDRGDRIVFDKAKPASNNEKAIME